MLAVPSYYYTVNSSRFARISTTAMSANSWLRLRLCRFVVNLLTWPLNSRNRAALLTSFNRLGLMVLVLGWIGSVGRAADHSGDGLIPPSQWGTVATMSIATIEQFQSDPASLLAVVEKGEPILISRGAEPIARLLPVEGADSLEVERQNWLRTSEQNLARAYGPDEPEYRPDQIVEANPDYEP